MDSHDGMTHVQRTRRIAELNDRLRTTGQGGRMFVTQAVAALPHDVSQQLLVRLRSFADFTPNNDPHGEHDFGMMTLDGAQYAWKIDYYDINLEYGSHDPADETITCRVLNLMAAGDL